MRYTIDHLLYGSKIFCEFTEWIRIFCRTVLRFFRMNWRICKYINRLFKSQSRVSNCNVRSKNCMETIWVNVVELSNLNDGNMSVLSLPTDTTTIPVGRAITVARNIT